MSILPAIRVVFAVGLLSPAPVTAPGPGDNRPAPPGLGPAGGKNRVVFIRADFMRADAKTAASLAEALAKAEPFDLVFLDPPYEMAGLDDAIRYAATLTAPGGRIVVEHSKKRELPATVPFWSFTTLSISSI